ncbi:MAG: hypothetical protein M3431_03090, partial [Actinomycetota bacterium]|nr:hypothetical protein [Actinomycetota bacterium]
DARRDQIRVVGTRDERPTGRPSRRLQRWGPRDNTAMRTWRNLTVVVGAIAAIAAFGGPAAATSPAAEPIELQTR